MVKNKTEMPEKQLKKLNNTKSKKNIHHISDTVTRIK